jgi:hypothetical protein
MKEKCEALNREQTEFACSIFSKWMNICEDNNRGSSSADVDHSSLLRRMLLGGKIHKNPPPLRRSYPAWELVEQEEIEIHEIHDSDIIKPGEVVVDQHRGYEWVDKENKILKHIRLGIEYQYLEREVTPKAKYLRKGLKPEEHKYIGKFLKRLNDPPTGKEEIWTEK